MPKLAEIVGCDNKNNCNLFSWIGIKEAASEEATRIYWGDCRVWK